MTWFSIFLQVYFHWLNFWVNFSCRNVWAFNECTVDSGVNVPIRLLIFPTKCTLDTFIPTSPFITLPYLIVGVVTSLIFDFWNFEAIFHKENDNYNKWNEFLLTSLIIISHFRHSIPPYTLYLKNKSIFFVNFVDSPI